MREVDLRDLAAEEGARALLVERDARLEVLEVRLEEARAAGLVPLRGELRVGRGEDPVLVLDAEGGDGVAAVREEGLEVVLRLLRRPRLGERVAEPAERLPTAGEEPARDDLALCTNKYSALEGADALAICTEWQQFRAPDFDEMESLLKAKVIVDGRNLYNPERLTADGWSYQSIGRNQR